MSLSTSAPLATGADGGADRGPARTPALDPSGAETALHAGARDHPDHPHPVAGHEPTGGREQVAVSGGGTP